MYKMKESVANARNIKEIAIKKLSKLRGIQGFCKNKLI